MNQPDAPHPVVAAFRGEQVKPTVILLSSTSLMLAWKYFGSPEFYRAHFSLWPISGADPDAAAAIYSFGLCFLLLGIVPVLIVKRLFRESLADYGVQLGNRARTVRTFLMLAPVFVLIAYLSSRDVSVLTEYPVNKIAGKMFGLHACTYALFYLGWEFHFRGFLQFGLQGRTGLVNAILIQVMASSLLHIGKPPLETFAAIGGGILWGVIAYRTRSLLSGLLQHLLLGIALDYFICYV